MDVHDPSIEGRTRVMAASADRVWEFITTVSSLATWYDDYDKVEHSLKHRHLKVGDTFRLVDTTTDATRSVACQVTDADTNRTLRWVEFAVGTAPVIVSFEFRADGTNQTTMTHTKQIRAIAAAVDRPNLAHLNDRTHASGGPQRRFLTDRSRMR